MCKNTRAFAFLITRERMHMWQMQWDVQGDIVFMEAPPFPLLWFASGVYSSSRWHHCPGRGEKILYKDTAWNPLTACLRFTIRHCYWIPKCSWSNVAHFAVLLLVGFFSLWLCFALPEIWTCDHYGVYLLAEAEHGYASMPPFISSRERESLKRKSKSKKNTSSR